MAITRSSAAENPRTSRRRLTWRALTVAAGASAALAFVVPGAAASPAQQASAGRTYYVDCGSGSDTAAGTTAQTAWRTLAHVNTITFRPGDSILLRRGTTCNGVLSPQGSGTAASPIVVSAYGPGARPAIAAGGARAAVFLNNVQGWEIRHLDISDTTTADGTPRTGIYVLLTNFGTGSHYVIDDVNVHDVTGCDCTGPDTDDSGGIVFKAAGSSVPTGFDGIQVTGSTVSGVDGYGIATASQWSLRSLFPGGENTFVPISHVLISGNNLSNLGGDGIVVQNGASPLIQYNQVNGFGLRPTIVHAGIWAWNSDHPVMQFNNVSHGSPYAMAFDVDGADSNVVYQYNYSHDNGAGFILFCAVAGMQTNGATIRYNISQNDLDSAPGTVITNACEDPETNVSFYNNVIYTTVAPALITNYGGTAISFSNNIFVGPAAGGTISDQLGVFSHNVYENITSVPAGDTAAVTADPRFTSPGSGVLGYLLACGSPAVGAGVVVAGNGGRDFFGLPVPAHAAPNIGATQGCVHA